MVFVIIAEELMKFRIVGTTVALYITVKHKINLHIIAFLVSDMP